VQEHQVGREKVEVVQILQSHHVIVRGGAEEGRRLVDALVVRMHSAALHGYRAFALLCAKIAQSHLLAEARLCHFMTKKSDKIAAFYCS
jgi:hypothetical protein